MRIDILTLFPDMFAGPFDLSILGRARERGLVDLRLRDIRAHTSDRHHVVDDYPYGGGAGMVMKPEPIFQAVEAVLADSPPRPPDRGGSLPFPPPPGEGWGEGDSGGEKEDLLPDSLFSGEVTSDSLRGRGAGGATPPIILMSPQGRRFTQAVARELAALPWLVLLCGHYEGVDERVREHLVSDEISLGDYVLTGGELAAMVVVDAVARLLPGVLGSDLSLSEESHSAGLLEYPQYTRPATFRGWTVPDILLSGHHAKVAEWRRRQAILRTWQRRPDLLAAANLTEAERAWLAEVTGAVL